MTTLSPGKLWGLRRMADENGIFKMTAVDQRPPIKGPIAAHLGVDTAPWDQVARFKGLLVETLQAQSTAMLLDPHYAIPYAVDMLSPTKGLIVTLEDSLFEETPEGRFSSDIDDWSVAKIKRMGGDAVKVLAWYRPDAGDAVNAAQKDYVKRIGEECAKHDIPFLFELLVYPLATDAHQTKEYIEMQGKKADDVLASVEEFAKPDYGVDVFKLESPVNASDADGSSGVQAVFDEMGRLAGRPWVMLSAGAGKPEFARVLEHAFAAGASGFLAGRAIWLDAFSAYPDWERIKIELEGGAADYMGQISRLADAKAANWAQHFCYGEGGARFTPADASFRHSYAEA
ncbi:tagatose 1,6-diphosphate aldolase [Aliiroseovarius sp. M344]|uniref:tagatose 1,6-diphosphate aldolase n=1 Tax=Aliiroseovarius sp. M344 TaxID=2867010 RepID=UPI0021AD76B3|nr:tagatose 1,6-diphosphate aldolase [Aliiroseovarius sp. M344]UWQ15371.1 tagatose 1,6-diphosphate aldolase [Aliiroseovarius sp. M344]